MFTSWLVVLFIKVHRFMLSQPSVTYRGRYSVATNSCSFVVIFTPVFYIFDERCKIISLCGTIQFYCNVLYYFVVNMPPSGIAVTVNFVSNLV